MLTLALAHPDPAALARPALARPAFARGAALAASLMLSLLAPACQESEPEATTQGDSSTGEPVETEPHVTFVGTVDTVDLCGVVGATHISFRARQVGCEPGPPTPCTLQTDPYKEWLGEAAMCPGGQTAHELRVDVPVHGRFEVEARTITDTGGTLSLCYGAGGSVPTPVTKDQVEARAEVSVKPTSGPCSG